MNTRRELQTAFDANGTAVVFVPVANGRGTAELHADDYASLSDAGVCLNFCLNDNGQGSAYVRAHQVGGNMVNVARFIAQAQAGHIVRYVDGNRLNLRRGNLAITEGKARMDCRPIAEIREAA